MTRSSRWAGTWTAEPQAEDLCDPDGRLRWKAAGHVLFYGTFGWATAQAAPAALATPAGRLLLVGAGTLLIAWYTYWAVLRARRRGGSLALRALHVAVTSVLWVLLLVADPSYAIVGIGVLAQVYGSLPWRMSLPGGAVVIGIMSTPAFFDAGLQGGEVVSALFSLGLVTLASLTLRAMTAESARRRRLIEELQATRDELANAERQAGMAQERQRLAAELHDTLTQGFTSIVMLLEAAQASVRKNQPKMSRDIESALGVARESLGEVRSLVWALRPEVLEQQTLAEALQRLTSRLENQSGVSTHTVVTGDARRLPDEIEAALLRAGQEALTNVRRHARAAQVTVTLSYLEHVVTLDIQDDGSGIDMQEPRRGSRQPGGLGLVAMRERVETLGGALDVESAPNEGTCIALWLPVEVPDPATVPSDPQPVAV